LVFNGSDIDCLIASCHATDQHQSSIINHQVSERIAMLARFRSGIAVVILSICVACAAAAPMPDTAYNRGVDAYRLKDYASARQHWAKAVEEGETSAFNNLGFLLYNGLGGEPDPARAVMLWKRAGELGHSEAQWHLAQALEVGKGTAASLIEAYAWYRCAIEDYLAAPQDDAESEIAQDARKSLIRILARLSIEQLSASEQLAREYVAKYAATPAAQH
jgi:TPR repeat protein